MGGDSAAHCLEPSITTRLLLLEWTLPPSRVATIGISGIVEVLIASRVHVAELIAGQFSIDAAGEALNGGLRCALRHLQIDRS